MQLVSFAVTNHKSIRDRMELELSRPSLRTLQPAEGRTWRDELYPVAAVFGANASGKTALVEALYYVLYALRMSAAGWMAEKHVPRAPFKLDVASLRSPSTYEIVFVHDSGSGPVRYEYTFSVAGEGIVHERLTRMPGARRQKVFERSGPAGDAVEVARGVSKRPAMDAVGARELVMSRALVVEHPDLTPIARALTEDMDVIPLGDHYKQARLQGVIESLTDGDTNFADLVALLQVADIGVTGLAVREDEVPEDLKRLVAYLRGGDGAVEKQSADEEGTTPAADDVGEFITRTLEFTHRGAQLDAQPLGLSEESSGTIAWLALAVPALDVLRRGGVLFVDELDASLHSHLLEVYLHMFTDPELNRGGGQLVFTSHDSHLLSSRSSVKLEPAQVWFASKGNDGATDIYSLADFPHHAGENVANRYLNGRYGAVPVLAPSLLRRLVEGRGAASDGRA